MEFLFELHLLVEIKNKIIHLKIKRYENSKKNLYRNSNYSIVCKQ